jgi:hypothetical protein
MQEKRLQEARQRGLARMAELIKAAGPVLDAGAVCSLLEISNETLSRKVSEKQLLAISCGAARVFPAFQFQAGEVDPGLAEVLAALDTDSPFVALSFLLSKNPDFDGKSACELLLAGKVEPVLAEARGFLNHGG